MSDTTIPDPREYLIAFLRALERAIPPPPPGRRHALVVVRCGSEEGGWGERLALSIAFPRGDRMVFIDPGDFDKPADLLVQECVAIVTDTNSLKHAAGAG